MSIIAEAQARVIDGARVAWHGAVSALDEAQRHAEILRQAHLMHDGDFYEAISAIGGMTTMLGKLIGELDRTGEPP